MSYIRNCLIQPRENDAPLFDLSQNSAAIRLDGYAIIPIELYESLRGGDCNLETRAS